MIRKLFDSVKEIKASNDPEDWIVLNVVALCIGLLIMLIGVMAIVAPMSLIMGSLFGAAAWLIGTLVLFLVSKLS